MAKSHFCLSSNTYKSNVFKGFSELQQASSFMYLLNLSFICRHESYNLDFDTINTLLLPFANRMQPVAKKELK